METVKSFMVLDKDNKLIADYRHGSGGLIYPSKIVETVYKDGALIIKLNDYSAKTDVRVVEHDGRVCYHRLNTLDI